MDFNFDEDNLFHDDKKGEQSNNIDIQDLDTLFEKSQNEGFDISLGVEELDNQHQKQSENGDKVESE
jgi:hypothetical protein